MKNMKNLIAGLILIIVFLLIGMLQEENQKFQNGFNIYLGLIFLIFGFNLYARRFLAFKAYFLSTFNVFAAKQSGSLQSDLPAEVIIDKLVEVLTTSQFNIKIVDYKSNQILALSKISWKSWGENIYIEVLKNSADFEVKFSSVAVFQMFTWGKNEANFKKFIKTFEGSLIV
jgi:hypothetical protein